MSLVHTIQIEKTNPQEVTIHRGSCFCGAVQFEFTSRPKVRALVNCTCDSCQKYLDACLYIRSDNFKITAGEDKVTCFRVGVGIVSNNFCSVCGVKVFRKVSNAPLKIANLLVAICGPHPPLEDTAELPSPTPEENTCAFKSGPEKCDVIGIGNIDAIQDKSISYEKILTVDMTKISWDEMKRLLSV
ncbi:uncharacterized protein LOC134855138 isoform X2 [Symsagittifera roscoffensis]|uniref:uncharacterized protein LOC134855138 isoform X2 n=1 Tax=Symsagittifera roscoffensis TaxID=84072 RepID=UPI00307B4A3C